MRPSIHQLLIPNYRMHEYLQAEVRIMREAFEAYLTLDVGVMARGQRL